MKMKLPNHVHFHFPKVIIKLLNSGNLKPPAVRSRYRKKHNEEGNSVLNSYKDWLEARIDYKSLHSWLNLESR